jgi:hypothetical protein
VTTLYKELITLDIEHNTPSTVVFQANTQDLPSVLTGVAGYSYDIYNNVIDRARYFLKENTVGKPVLHKIEESVGGYQAIKITTRALNINTVGMSRIKRIRVLTYIGANTTSWYTGADHYIYFSTPIIDADAVGINRINYTAFGAGATIALTRSKQPAASVSGYGYFEYDCNYTLTSTVHLTLYIGIAYAKQYILGFELIGEEGQK